MEEDYEQNYNIGVSYDKLSNGMNFRNEPFGLRIQSSMPSGIPNQSFAPHSLFLFVQNENTIVFRDGQVSVLS